MELIENHPVANRADPCVLPGPSELHDVLVMGAETDRKPIRGAIPEGELRDHTVFAGVRAETHACSVTKERREFNLKTIGVRMVLSGEGRRQQQKCDCSAKNAFETSWLHALEGRHSFSS
jgi:hypothetical protein